MRRPRVTRAIGPLVSVVCLVILVRTIDPAPLARAARHVHPWWLALSAVAMLIYFAIQATRWRLILAPLARFAVPRLVRWNLMGYLANTLLPFRGGDLARGVLAGQASGAGVSAGVTTIVVEKICDGVVLVGYLLVVIVLMRPPEWVQVIAAMAGVGFAAGLVVLLSLRLPAVEALTRRLASGRAAQRLVEAIYLAVPPPPTLAALMARTMALWLAAAANTWCILRTVGIDVSPVAAMLVTSGLNLALVVPAGPAAIGSYDLAAVTLVGAIGVDQAHAQLAALCLRAAQYAPPSILGLGALWIEGASLGDLWRRGAAARSPSTPPAGLAAAPATAPPPW